MSDKLIKKSDLAMLGKAVLSDAKDSIREKCQDNATRIAEHVLNRIIHHEQQIDIHKKQKASYEKKRDAIEAGEFSVNTYDGTIKMNDPELEKLP